MSGDSRFRRLRGAVGNAVVWGIGWCLVAVTVLGALRLVGVVATSWTDVFVTAIKFGIIGTIAGGAFAGVIRLLYHGKRLSEISWVRFGLGGALVTGVFVPLFLQTMNWLSGDGFVPAAAVLDDALTTAVFGGVAAACSLKLAQRADALLRGGSTDQADRLGGGDR